MTTTPHEPDLIELDSRKRAPLRAYAHHKRYFVSEEDDGTLVLTPATVMPDLEARLLRNDPELHARLVESTSHPERLVRHTLT